MSILQQTPKVARNVTSRDELWTVAFLLMSAGGVVLQLFILQAILKECADNFHTEVISYSSGSISCTLYCVKDVAHSQLLIARCIEDCVLRCQNSNGNIHGGSEQ
ncbi:hypothetical protein OPV22_021547 [Ensete ventricosum]|uniref:Uncharacterized protein n=1 Tax=Ensete ventricosum TaxID=4639 RepID=A0AAV8QQI1_ENSVE|nr:hypothetical protein OPV22_021547 [Ensete ventricosum]